MTTRNGYFTEANSADVVIARNAKATDARLAEVMAVIIRHLHAAVKEIEPTEEEWMTAIQFLTEDRPHVQRLAAGIHPAVRRAGRVDAGRCDQQPQTVAARRNPRSWARSTSPDAPELPMGADICLDQKGEPMRVTGRILDTDGQPDCRGEDRRLAGQ